VSHDGLSTRLAKQNAILSFRLLIFLALLLVHLALEVIRCISSLLVIIIIRRITTIFITSSATEELVEITATSFLEIFIIIIGTVNIIITGCSSSHGSCTLRSVEFKGFRIWINLKLLVSEKFLKSVIPNESLNSLSTSRR